MKLSWNFLETPLKHPYNTLETPMKHPWNTLETPLKHISTTIDSLWHSLMLYDTPNALQTSETLKKKKGTNKRTDEQTDGRTNGRTNKRTNLVTTSLLELLVAAKNCIYVYRIKTFWGSLTHNQTWYGSFWIIADKWTSLSLAVPTWVPILLL